LKIFITGASGFLGGHLVHLLSKNHKVIGSYKSYCFNTKNVDAIQCDLVDQNSFIDLLNLHKPDIIIHNAALANPERCEENPGLAHKANITSTEIIARYCSKNSLRLVFISTDMVFNGKKGYYSERDPVSPINIYAKTKVKAENIVLSQNKNSVVCRIALMYGKGFFPREYNSEWLERVLLHKIKINSKEPVQLFTDQYRSMISVLNAAKAIIEAALLDLCGIIHIGGIERISRFEFGKELCEKLNIPVNLIKGVKSEEVVTKALRPLDVSFNISKAKSLLKTPLLNVQRGLEEIYGQ
jgi:dTDP-4-dehydrorhamnose reductase